MNAPVECDVQDCISLDVTPHVGVMNRPFSRLANGMSVCLPTRGSDSSLGRLANERKVCADGDHIVLVLNNFVLCRCISAF